MFQLRLVKPSVLKNAFRHTNVRMFSYTPTSYPFLLIDHLLDIEDRQGDGRARQCYERDLPNGGTQKGILITDLALRDDICDAMTFGFSRNGLVTFDSSRTVGDDNSLSIFINHKLSDPEIKDVRISLPLLPSASKIQSIAMSGLPVRDKDWVVGVKLSGSRLSFCRPFGNRKWFDIKAMPESISPFSSLMFSKKDQKFYIPSPGGKHLSSVNLNFEDEEEEHPELIDIEFDQLPKSALGDLEDVSQCSRTDHLVESPTGELFLVKWYGDDLNEDFELPLMHKTQQFMVFRAEEAEDCEDEKTMIYTEDIGDLCIFLGHSEAICVPASSSPGLRPNCIYFVGYSFGVYDLTTKTCTNFLVKNHKKKKELLRESGFLYWPLPLPLD